MAAWGRLERQDMDGVDSVVPFLRRNKERTRFGPALGSKTLPVCLHVMDLLLVHIGTLYAPFRTMQWRGFRQKYTSSAFWKPAGKTVEAAGFVMPRQLSDAANCCVGGLATNEDSIRRPSNLWFLGLSIWSITGSCWASQWVQNEDHSPTCSTGDRQTVRTLGLDLTLDFHLRSWSGSSGTCIVVAVEFGSFHAAYRSYLCSGCSENCGCAPGWNLCTASVRTSGYCVGSVWAYCTLADGSVCVVDVHLCREMFQCCYQPFQNCQQLL